MPVTASRGQTLLAMLLLHANRVTATDELIDAIWPAKTPHDARTLLQGCVSRLRKRFAEAGVTGQIIITEPAGYRITIDPDGLDLLEFRRLLAEARTASYGGKYEQAADLYREALDLWRGPALAGIDSPLVRQAATALDEEHTQALEERFTSGLAAGGAGDLVPELTELVQRHPHREGLHRCLMLALYRAGRQADALAAYRHAHQLQQEELGTEPGHELQELHRAILNRDSDLHTRHQAPPATPPTPVPRELPADVSNFTGRGDALQALDDLLIDRQDAVGPVVISNIAGTAGVGKTALAVHWAHRVADRFPDGQLYVNLRGYDPGQPMSPADALARFLTALGVAGQEMPRELDDRAARYRSELAGKQTLILLDNAATVEQVRPLLPGANSCTVVVTSRDRLTGLIALHGAHRLDLDLLPPADATALMRRLIGTRVDDEPDAAAALVDQCARLPLALRVAAEHAVTRAATPLSELAADLADQRRRLELLNASGDPHSAVSAVFSWSIRQLPPDAARTFRLLGLHPGPHIDPYAVAALTNASLEQACGRLDLLTRSHLVHATSPERYAMHDLLRAYATELTRTHDTEQVRHTALSRLLDHYRHTASVAMDTAYPHERERRPRIPPTDTPAPNLSDPNQATGWLDIEHPNLLAAARHAADHGWPEHTLDLSAILHRHLRIRDHNSDAKALHHQALTTARAIGNRAGELHALTSLGWAHVLQGRHEQAADHFEQALEIARITGNRTGELDALRGRGRVHRRQGRHEQAIDHHRQALEIARTIGNRTGELDALIDLAFIHLVKGQHEQAAGHYQQALEIARTIGNRVGELHALNGLGHIHWLQGRHEQATGHYQQALEIARATGNQVGKPAALTGLGHSHRLQGQHEQAANCFRQVLDLARETGNRNWQFEALHGLGRLHHSTGSPDAALAHHRQALKLATDLGQPVDQARTHDGIARAHHALNQPEQARLHWQRALDILTSLGINHTDEPEANTSTIRTHLAALDPEQEGQ